MYKQQPESKVDVMYGLALVIALAVLGIGIYWATRGVWTMLAAGSVALIGVLVTWPLARQLAAIQQANADRSERALSTVIERFEEFSIMLNLISEQQLLSDRAKAVAFREKDSDVLRRAIQEESLKGNWEAAGSLADDMEASFGYKQEADRLRAQINSHQQDHIRKQIGEVAGVIDRHARGEAWAEALVEAQKLASQFPAIPAAANMPQEVENRRQTHKKQLIDSWNEAVNRHDVDGAIEILKRLDMYLTPTEAEAYQESARSIFKEKLNNLRTQFSLAVQDHKWADAIRIGDTISRDFPNTQMAKEVREMMESLRARAQGLQPAAVS